MNIDRVSFLPRHLFALSLTLFAVGAHSATPSSVPSVEVRVTVLNSSFLPEDSLILNNVNPPTPQDPAAANILSMAGVFTAEQLKVVQDSLADVSSEFTTFPPAITRSGRQAKVQVTQQVRHATDYQIGTPPTPTQFDTKDVGFILEAIPKVASDGYTIELEVRVHVLTVSGYQALGGEPVLFSKASGFTTALPDDFPLDESVQPIFSKREVTTNATIYDGSTIVLTNQQDKLSILITAEIVKARKGD
jgi:hypothetical protein